MEILKKIIKYLYVQCSGGIVDVNKTLKFPRRFTNLIFLANGSSTDEAQFSQIEFRSAADLLVTNFFASTDFFERLRPDIYVILDPLFWDIDVSEHFQKKRANTYDKLSSVSWPMTLYVPRQSYAFVSKLLVGNRRVLVKSFQINEFDNIHSTLYPLFLKLGICTPPSYNVALYALWLGIILGYRTISIYGLQMSQFKSIEVNQKTNQTFTGGLHFYDDKYKPEPAKKTYGAAKTIADRFWQIYVSHRGFELIQMYAASKHVNIVNRSKESYVDAFDRPD